MANEKGYLISDELRVVLGEVIGDHLNRQRGRNRPPGAQLEHDLRTAPEVYVARAPAGGIPTLYELYITGTGSGTGTHYLPGFTQCDIYQLDEGDYGMELVAVEDESQRVFNITACKVEEDTWIVVERDKFGTWLAVDTCGASKKTTSTTSTSSTSSTSSTTRPHHCLGSCRWTCDGNYQWQLAVYGCEDYYGVTGTGELAGSGTNAMGHCNCAPPTFCCADCGTIGVTETVTSCIGGGGIPVPVCPGTTTTSTTTSTTTAPGCTGCVFIWWQGGWLLQHNGCSLTLELEDGATWYCGGCALPTDAGAHCEVRSHGCGPPGTTRPRPGYCEGTCLWYWLPDQAEVYGWYFYSGGCRWENVDGCVCDKPARAGNDCGDQAITPCYVPGTTTNTTPPPYTTTRPPGCTGYCQWVWTMVDGDWQFTCSNCPAGCVCDSKPYYPGMTDGEGAVTQCHPPTSTTSTSTTSTTTRPPCDGLCYWWCNNGVWQGLHDTCDGSNPDCQCWSGDTPANQVCNPGDDYIGTEPCKVATTTTSTTTTSTTSSTTTTGTIWYCYDLYDCGRVGSGEDCFGSTCSIHLGRECAISPHNRCQTQVGTFHVYQWIQYSGPYSDYGACNAACNPTSTTTNPPTSSTSPPPA